MGLQAAQERYVSNKFFSSAAIRPTVRIALLKAGATDIAAGFFYRRRAKRYPRRARPRVSKGEDGIPLWDIAQRAGKAGTQCSSAGDLLPLEYALLFIRTPPQSLHIDPFNGIYYKMAWTARGIAGQLHDVDMDPFIAPDSVPPQRRQRPIGGADLAPGDPRSHWLPLLTIE